MTKTRRLIGICSVGAALIAAATALRVQPFEPDTPDYSTGPSSHVLLGKPAPDLQMRLVYPRLSLLRHTSALRTRDRHLRDYRGRVVVLHFWASWCSDCLPEMLQLATVARTYRTERVQLLAPAYRDTPERIDAYLRQHHDLGYPIALLGASDAEARYAVRGVPQTFVIDGSGTVRSYFHGPAQLDSLRAAIEMALDLVPDPK